MKTITVKIDLNEWQLEDIKQIVVDLDDDFYHSDYKQPNLVTAAKELSNIVDQIIKQTKDQ